MAEQRRSEDLLLRARRLAEEARSQKVRSSAQGLGSGLRSPVQGGLDALDKSMRPLNQPEHLG